MFTMSVCLFVCSLVPSIGKTESVAASSCKEVRDVLSNECSGGPQSGTYWVTVTDPHTGDNRTMRVGQCYKLKVALHLNITYTDEATIGTVLCLQSSQFIH